jgi:hypothetical protein
MIHTAQAQARTVPDDSAIKPFNVHSSDEALADLKRRVAAIRWPDKDVADQSQGVPLATLQRLAAWEQPEIFTAELRAAFKSLRRPQ